MIVINLVYTMKEGKKAADFVKQIEDAQLGYLFRVEKGNCCYRYFYPADGANQVFLLEKWEDEESLAEHMRTVYFKKLIALGDEYVESRELLKFEE